MSSVATQPTLRRFGAWVPQGLGLPTAALIAWLGFEYMRPPNPMKIPYMISLALLAAWIFHKEKRWNPQIVLMLLFLGQMILSIPFTENNFAARMTTRELFTVIMCIAVPLAHFVDTLKRNETLFYTWIAIFVYMGVIALMNGGNGPGGAHHGVDENYTALFMGMALSFAFFGALTVDKMILKVALYAACALFVCAIVAGMSRGGFVGMVAVAALCWWRSPGKIVALLGGVVAVILFLVFVPESYMGEVQSIGDTQEETADARIKMWFIAVRIWLDYPVFGVGPGNYRWLMNAYKDGTEAGLGQAMYFAHSLYFEMLAEMGTTGVACWFGIFYFNVRDCRLITKVSKRSRRIAERVPPAIARGPLEPSFRRLGHAEAWSSALLGALIGFAVCSVFLSTLYYTTYWLLTALVVSLRESTLREERALREALSSVAETPESARAEAPRPVSVRPEKPASLSGLLRG